MLVQIQTARVSESVGLGWSPEICISDRTPGVARAAITKHHRWSDLNIGIYFLTVLKVGKFKIKVLTDLTRTLFLACKQLPSCSVPTGKRGREYTASTLICLLIQVPIPPQGPTPI